MQSIRMLAVLTGTLVLASACGDGGGTPPPDNEAPVANFTAPTCTVNLACTFIDASTDDVAVTGWDWDFGDATAHAITEDAAHTYTTAGPVNVTLTVRDVDGLTGTRVNPLTVAPVAPPVNVPPTASFTSACNGNTCAFTSTSTDGDGTIATYAWNFGEPASGAANTSALQNPSHTYAAVAQATDFTVTLTVTDDDGAASVVAATGTVTIQPPLASQCTTAGGVVDCTLGVTARSTVKLTLTGIDCELGASRINIALPLPTKLAFGNVCSKTIGLEYTILDGAGAPLVFEAGSQFVVRFTQGVPDPGDPALGAPRANVQGTGPTWTISIDDGGNPTGAGEPDFTDVVLLVQATAQ